MSFIAWLTSILLSGMAVAEASTNEPTIYLQCDITTSTKYKAGGAFEESAVELTTGYAVSTPPARVVDAYRPTLIYSEAAMSTNAISFVPENAFDAIDLYSRARVAVSGKAQPVS